jgi:hypothetical protein
MKLGLTGLEPVTLRLSSACCNQLSYRPKKFSDLTIEQFNDWIRSARSLFKLAIRNWQRQFVSDEDRHERIERFFFRAPSNLTSSGNRGASGTSPKINRRSWV